MYDGLDLMVIVTLTVFVTTGFIFTIQGFSKDEVK